MEAAGLASSIITFLDLTAKVIIRITEYTRQGHEGPAYLRTIETQLPLLEKTLPIIKREAESGVIAPDVCAELRKIISAAHEEVGRLNTYVELIKPGRTATGLSKFNIAVKSVLRYDDKIEQILKKLKVYVEALSFFQTTATTDRSNDIIQRLRLIQHDQIDLIQQKERDSIRKWLDSPARDQYIEDCSSKRAPQTCEWIFETTAYKHWCSSNFAASDPKVLWIHGPPGFGKTFIAARIFTSIEESGVTDAVAVFWTSEAKFANQTLSSIPRSWLSQLLTKRPEYCESVKPTWLQSKSESASANDVWHSFRNLLLYSTEPITFVIDGLDEYNHQQAKRYQPDTFSHQQNLRYESITEFLRTLKGTLRGTRCRLLCVSQPDSEIRSGLSPAKLREEGFAQAYDHAVTKDDVSGDVTAFAKRVIESKLPKKTANLKADLVKMVAEKAEGQMLWIAWQEREEGYFRPSFSENKCRKAVADMPVGLENTYQANMDRINRLSEYKNKRALRMLVWVMFALRSLTVHELVEAVLIEEEDDFAEVPEDELPDDPDEEDVYGEIRTLCGNFIAFDIDDEKKEPRSWKVRFAHSSIRAFLEKKFVIQPTSNVLHETGTFQSSTAVAAACLRYLMCTNIWPTLDAKDVRTVCLPNHPLLAYAGSYFVLHVDKENRDPLKPLLHEFLVNRFSNYERWKFAAAKTKDSANLGLAPLRKWNWPSRLAFAASMGLQEVVNELSNLEEFSNVKNLAPALTAASWFGDVALVELLLARGAGVNQANEYGNLPLTSATWVGNQDVVAYLIAKGANVNASVADGTTALHQAAQHGQVEVARVLLSHGADPTIVNSFAQTALLYAVKKQSTEIVDLLLQDEVVAGRTINRTNQSGDFPLLSSAWNGNQQIFQSLLRAGANPAQVGWYGQTALWVAARHGRKEIIDSLLSGNDSLLPEINKVTHWSGYSALHAAVMAKNLQIVQNLVVHGADVSRRDYNSYSALDWALTQGSTDIVEYFLTSGANVSPSDAAYREYDPLHYACLGGSVELVKALLDKGADARGLTKTKCTPLEIAAMNGHAQVVQLLLATQEGLETINWFCEDDEESSTALLSAAAAGYVEIVQILLDHGADVTAKSSRGFSVYDKACYSGSLDLVTLLLTRSGLASASDEYMLHGAAEGGHWEIFDLVSQHHKINSSTYDSGMTILHCAASGGDVQILEAILKQCDATLLCCRDNDAYTPLQYSCGYGHHEATKMLLDRYSRSTPRLTFDASDVFLAVGNGNLDIVKALLQHDRSRFMTARIADDWSPVMEACRTGQAEVMEFLLSEGFKLLEQNAWGATSLHFHAVNGHASIAKFFKDIDWESALKIRTRDGVTPILYSCYHGKSVQFRQFVACGASVCDRQESSLPITMSAFQGASTLHFAASCGNIEIAEIILESLGPSCLEWTDTHGAHPVHYAAGINDNAYMVEWLHEKGAILSVMNNAGDTPLVQAVAMDNRECAAFLIKQGVIPANKRTRSSLLGYAATCDTPYILRLLLESGLTLADCADLETTLLHIAVSDKGDKTMAFLLELGQSWDAIDTHGWTVRDCLKLIRREDLDDELKDELPSQQSTWKAPTRWAFDSSTNARFVSDSDGTIARLKLDKAAGSSIYGITANHYLLPTARESYFEITITKCPPTRGVAIGLERFIGEKSGFTPGPNCIYMGDTGSFAPFIYSEGEFSVPFGEGDTIGCGFDYEAKDGALFFTKNGECLGTAVHGFRPRLVPTVYTTESSLEVSANFGQKPFEFAVEKHGYGKKDCRKCYSANGELQVLYGRSEYTMNLESSVE